MELKDKKSTRYKGETSIGRAEACPLLIVSGHERQKSAFCRVRHAGLPSCCRENSRMGEGAQDEVEGLTCIFSAGPMSSL